MPYTPPQFFIQICYGIVLFPLYIYVLLQFLLPSKNKPFKSFFFKLALALGIVDITQYAVVWIYVKITACSLTYHILMGYGGFYVFNILNFLNYYVVVVRCYLTLLSAANRFTALSLPLRHEKIWSKFGIYTLLFSFIFPFPFFASSFFGSTKIVIVNEAIVIDVRAEWFPISRTLLSLFQLLFTIITSLFFNLGAFFSYLKRKTSSSLSYSVETKLLMITFWDLIVDIAYSVARTIMIYRTYITGRTDNDDTPYICAIWLMDLGNLFRPIFLILMCEALRQRFLTSVGIKRKETSVVVFSNDK